MSVPVAVLDACSLVPIRLATTLLWLAEAGLFQPRWSGEILDEVQRNLPKVGVPPDRAAHRVNLMREAFGAEAMVEGFDDLLDLLHCDPKDRHVLATAIRGEAETIVTFNIKDFPDTALRPHGVTATHPDEFLTHILTQHAALVVSTLRRETAAFRNPPEDIRQFLAALAATVPRFAHLAAVANNE